MYVLFYYKRWSILGTKIGFICKAFYEYISIFTYSNNSTYFEYIIWVKTDFLKSIRYSDNVFAFEYTVTHSYDFSPALEGIWRRGMDLYRASTYFDTRCLYIIEKKNPGWRSCSCPFLIYMYFILWFGPSFCGFYLPAILYLAKRLLKTRLH